MKTQTYLETDVAERYVLNQMSEAEREDFEFQLLLDENLRNTVSLLEIIYKAAENEAEKKRIQTDIEIAKKGDYFLRLAAMIMLVLFAASYVTKQQGFDVLSYLPQPSPDAQEMFSVDLFASAYELNPFLEDYITQVFRNDSQQVTIAYPQENIEFEARAQTERIRFEATIPVNYRSEILVLKLYTNSVEDYLNEVSLIGQPLNIMADGQALAEIEIPLHRGLYYLVVENQSTLEPIAVQRIWVR